MPDTQTQSLGLEQRRRAREDAARDLWQEDQIDFGLDLPLSLSPEDDQLRILAALPPGTMVEIAFRDDTRLCGILLFHPTAGSGKVINFDFEEDRPFTAAEVLSVAPIEERPELRF